MCAFGNVAKVKYRAWRSELRITLLSLLHSFYAIGDAGLIAAVLINFATVSIKQIYICPWREIKVLVR